MSTRSFIMVKARKEDIGKLVKFSENDLYDLGVEQSDWSNYCEDTIKDLSEETKIDGKYFGIYCHNDGYLDGVGEALKEKFNSYEKALNLISGGSCSVVLSDHVRRYANRSGEKWQYIHPRNYANLSNIKKDYWDVDYFYMFDDEHGWRYSTDCKYFKKF